MLIVLPVMFALSAALPFIGLVRLVRSQYEEEKPLPTGMSGPEEIAEMGRRIGAGGRRDAWTDLALIGAGLTLGAVASILALPWPALWGN
jgi:hypothetical protein